MLYEFLPGEGPVLINVPHAGETLPGEMKERLTPAGAGLVDTDWHVHRLVDFAPKLGVSLLRATCSRYVIDLNRGPEDQPLYRGPTTGLVPTETFDGEPLYRAQEPDEAEIRSRVDHYWRPYHDRLALQLEAIRERHGYAVLLDAHSIRSRVQRLFEGRLPDLNLGTFDGNSCAPDVQDKVENLLNAQNRFSHVVNGRFKGGYITRHYGRPSDGIHALQLEIVQACYMDELCTESFDESRARPLKAFLHQLVESLVMWRPK